MKFLHAEKNRISYYWLILAICIGIFISVPVVRPGLLVTDDAGWMVIRLSAFYQSLREGQFPVRFLGRLNYSYGYPVSNFLYPGFLYVGSFLHAAGLTFQTTIEVIMVGFVGLGALFLYKWLRCFFDTRASALGVIAYLLNPYLLYDLFKRGSVGELVAIGTVFAALYSVEYGLVWMIPLSVAFLILSHNTLGLFFMVLLGLYIFVKRKWAYFIYYVVGIGIATFFWLPALIESRLVSFQSIQISNPFHYFSTSHSLIKQSIPLLFLAGVSFYTSKAIGNGLNRLMIGIVVCSVFFASEVSSIFWNSKLLIQLVQFPYRFLALMIIPLPWFVAMITDSKNFKRGLLFTLLSLGILFYFSLNYQKSESLVQPEGFYTTNESTTTVSNEYMPRGILVLPLERARQKAEIINGNAEITTRTESTEKIDITIDAQEESELQINTLYYPGWGALLDGQRVEIMHDNDRGIMKVQIPEGEHTLYMAFRETKSRFIADVISLISVVIWVLLWFKIIRSKSIKLESNRKNYAKA